MTRWIAAAVAIVAAGIGGAMFVPGADAQPVPPEAGSQDTDAKAEKPIVVFETEAGKVKVELKEDGRNPSEYIELPDYFKIRAVSPVRSTVIDGFRHGQPGTWQIVAHKDMLLLLNTASGDSFHLRETGVGGGVKWEPIPRPEPPRQIVIRNSFLPDPQLLPRGSDRRHQRPDDDVKRRVEERRERENEGRDDKKPDHEQKLADFEKAVDQIENQLNDIAKRLNDAGPDERAKLREQRRKLEKKLDDLERELRDMREDR